MMFIKHYAPNRCLCIKVANSIDHWVERIAEMSQRQGVRGICTKNGSYCEKQKKGGEVGGGGGGGGLRGERGGGGGVRVDVN